jgi:flagellum-specific ATP synthase
LPRLLERGGVHGAGGSLTALYTVLVEGDDVNEPISDAVRSILDGHIVLSRDIAHRGRYPAIDVTRSVSRLATSLIDERERAIVADAIKLLATYETSRDLIEVGAYRSGTTPAVDRAIQLVPALEQFLAQRPDETEARAAACARLEKLLAAQVQDARARMPRPVAPS